jgi:hypothetical protein
MANAYLIGLANDKHIRDALISTLKFLCDSMNNLPSRKYLSLHLLLLGVLVTALIGASCRRKLCEPPPAVDEHDLFPGITEKLSVDVYLDATLSMKGFVTAGTESYFQQTLPILESAVISGWSGGKANFFKFGNDVAALEGRGHLKASNAEFYADRNYNTKTFIEKVIDKAQTKHLTIIITDLYQNDADVNQLSDKLRDKYIANGLAIGVYAVKSQFNGPIYDVGPNNYSFTYKTDNAEPKTFRPFYLLALGSHADIQKYFEGLEQSGFSAFPAEIKRQVIFSPYLTASPPDFENANITATKKLSRLARGTLLPPSVKDARVREFKIVGDADEAGFASEMKFNFLPYLVDTSPNLEPDIAAWKCDEKSAQTAQGGQLVESLSAREAFTLSKSNLERESNVLQFEAQIKPKALPGTGNYCYRIILRPATYQLPRWISEWNLNIGQIEAARSNKQGFDGSKTYNLQRFLNTIWGATQDRHRPKLTTIFCYFQREK